jgi:RHS repeat-associated protein
LTTDYGFTGQRKNGYLDTYSMGAREYDPSLGRWLSADTIVPDPANPQSLNRFAYVSNNPLKYVDPTGHFEDDAIKDYLRKKYGDGWEDIWNSWTADEEWMKMLHIAEGGDVLTFLSNESVFYFRFAGEGQTLLEDVIMSNNIVGSEDIGIFHLWQIYDLMQDYPGSFHEVGLFRTVGEHVTSPYVHPGVQVDVKTYTVWESALLQFTYGLPIGIVFLPTPPLIGLIGGGLASTFGATYMAEKIGGKEGDDGIFISLTVSGSYFYDANVMVRGGQVLGEDFVYTTPDELPNVNCGGPFLSCP